MGIFDTVFGIDCPNCGESISASAHFCQHCGVKIDKNKVDKDKISEFIDRSSSKNAGNRFSASNLNNYTPDHLREQVLSNRSSIEGERKQVTVLFVDIKSSQAIANQLDAEAWHDLLDRFFELLNRCIHMYEGTINQYTGDGVMALFGAPIAHEDHAQRAAYSALQIKRELSVLNEWLESNYNLELSARMGLNSGEVIVGKIGDDLRMDYTAQGATVGLAGRLEQLAGANRIFVSSTTAHLIRSQFKLRSLGRYEIKGEALKQRVFELTAPRPSRSRFDHTTNSLRPFVGREATIQQLEQEFIEVQLRTKSLKIVHLVGPAGIGKSRLSYEFARHVCAKHKALYLEARGVSHGHQLPLLPIIALIRNYFGIDDNTSITSTQKLIDDRLDILQINEPGMRQQIIDFLGLMPQAQSEEADAAQHKATINKVQLSSIYKLIGRMATAGSELETTIIVLDDVHLFDNASLRFISEIALLLKKSTARLFILCNYREGFTPLWLTEQFTLKDTLTAVVDVSPLTKEAMQTLIDAWLGDDESLFEIKQIIVEKTGGNPLFLEALVNELIDHEQLIGKPGNFHAASNVQTQKVPATIQALLSAKVDRLDDHEKHLLQVAAVVGQQGADRILYEASQLSFLEFSRAVATLVDYDFLRRHSLFPQATYDFPHPLLLETVYRNLLSTQRQQIHGLVAAAAAQQYRHQYDQAGLIAHHYDAAQNTAHAIHWYRAAANWAAEKDLPTALKHWQRIFELSELLQNDVNADANTEVNTEDTSQVSAAGIALEACARQLQLGSRLGMSAKEAAELYSTGRRLNKQYSQQILSNLTTPKSSKQNSSATTKQTLQDYSILLEMAMGTITALNGDLDSSLTHYRHAGLNATNDAQRVVVWVGLIHTQHSLGQNRQALATLKEALHLIDENPNEGAALFGRSPYVSLLLLKVLIYAEQGKYDLAQEHLRTARKLARKRNEHEHLAWGHCLKGFLHLRANKTLNWPMLSAPKPAEAFAEELVANKALKQALKAGRIARQSGNQVVYILAHTVQVQAQQTLKNYALAIDVAHTALQTIAENNTCKSFAPRLHILLSQTHYVNQATDLAIEHAKKAVTSALEYHTKGYLLEAYLLSAQLRLLRLYAAQQVKNNTQKALGNEGTAIFHLRDIDSSKLMLKADDRKQILYWLQEAATLAAETALQLHLPLIRELEAYVSA